MYSCLQAEKSLEILRCIRDILNVCQTPCVRVILSACLTPGTRDSLSIRPMPGTRDGFSVCLTPGIRDILSIRLTPCTRDGLSVRLTPCTRESFNVCLNSCIRVILSIRLTPCTRDSLNNDQRRRVCSYLCCSATEDGTSRKIYSILYHIPPTAFCTAQVQQPFVPHRSNSISYHLFLDVTITKRSRETFAIMA